MAEQAQVPSTTPTTSVPAQPATQQLSTTQVQPVEKISIWKKWWFWGIIVAVIVIVGLVIWLI